MIQIRRNLFETNSSSTHSLTMCTEADWLNWERGNIVYDEWLEVFISKKQAEEKMKETIDGHRYFFSPEKYFDYVKDNLGYDTFTKRFRGIIAFGYNNC